MARDSCLLEAVRDLRFRLHVVEPLRDWSWFRLLPNRPDSEHRVHRQQLPSQSGTVGNCVRASGDGFFDVARTLKSATNSNPKPFQQLLHLVLCNVFVREGGDRAEIFRQGVIGPSAPKVTEFFFRFFKLVLVKLLLFFQLGILLLQSFLFGFQGVTLGLHLLFLHFELLRGLLAGILQLLILDLESCGLLHCWFLDPEAHGHEADVPLTSPKTKEGPRLAGT